MIHVWDPIKFNYNYDLTHNFSDFQDKGQSLRRWIHLCCFLHWLYLHEQLTSIYKLNHVASQLP